MTHSEEMSENNSVGNHHDDKQEKSAKFYVRSGAGGRQVETVK